uniref:Uncharacterized protein n=1 Tax=Caenorhabditis tropicalis TaxID=1561998 RepID=A0A1I7T0C9_9PELO
MENLELALNGVKKKKCGDKAKKMGKEIVDDSWDSERVVRSDPVSYAAETVVFSPAQNGVSPRKKKILSKRQSKNASRKAPLVPYLDSSEDELEPARKRRTSKRSKKIRVPPIPLVYNWSYLHFEICYRYNTEKRYKDRMDQKPAEMSWTAYFKQLHRAENQAMGLIDDGQTTGPPTDPSTSTANHSNEDSASSSEIRVPPLRINPGYWENRHKYM